MYIHTHIHIHNIYNICIHYCTGSILRRKTVFYTHNIMPTTALQLLIYMPSMTTSEGIQQERTMEHGWSKEQKLEMQNLWDPVKACSKMWTTWNTCARSQDKERERGWEREKSLRKRARKRWQRTLFSGSQAQTLAFQQPNKSSRRKTALTPSWSGKRTASLTMQWAAPPRSSSPPREQHMQQPPPFPQDNQTARITCMAVEEKYFAATYGAAYITRNWTWAGLLAFSTWPRATKHTYSCAVRPEM